jgi:hypothetical protein
VFASGMCCLVEVEVTTDSQSVSMSRYRVQGGKAIPPGRLDVDDVDGMLMIPHCLDSRLTDGG